LESAGAAAVDDLTIPDDATLLRRIPPWHLVFDERLGVRRISSGAFADDQDGSPMSVFLASAVVDPGTVMIGHAEFGLAAITSGLARACGQIIVRDPLPEQPSHALVVGRKTNSVRTRLSRGANWVIPPP